MMRTFDDLLQQEYAVLERYVKYHVGDPADAEDVLQETCMAAYQSFVKLKEESAFKAWLLGIARHKCHDLYHEKAKRMEISIDAMETSIEVIGAAGRTTVSAVHETLDLLGDQDKQILYLYYFKQIPQAEIAERLKIPLGTVKSRLHTAKERFKRSYPWHPKGKGDNMMKTGRLPEVLPAYTITPSEKEPFEVRHCELPGMFIVPRLHEKIAFGMYDLPERKISGAYAMEVTGRIRIHGIDGVEIRTLYTEGDETEESTLFAQLTEDHCRYLGGIFGTAEDKEVITFLDEEFIDRYSTGENNCGFPTERKSRGDIIQKDGELLCDLQQDVSDIVGRFDVVIAGKTYDTVRLVDIQPSSAGAMLLEYYLDASGRTILERRFNQDDWAVERFQKLWSERLPDNERILVNGATFVHWYDCITDHIV